MWLVEGEKDADRLASLGEAATTTLMGAASWRDEYADFFAGAEEVRIVWDRDAPGRRYALAAAASLRRVGVKARFLCPRPKAKGADLSDHLDAGYSLAALRKAPPPDPDADKVKAAEATAKRDEKEHLPAPLQLALARLGESVKETGPEQWEARCPVHEDSHASLSIARGTERPVVVRCHADCDTRSIADALGIAYAEFSAERTARPGGATGRLRSWSPRSTASGGS